jgi:DnaJ-domain-containing protein 1
MAEGRRRAAAWTLATGRYREEKPPLSATSRQVLGLGPTATEAEVRKAYKSLCLAHHPDKHAAGTPEAQARAKHRFARIQAAYAKMSSAASSLPSYRSPFGRSAWGEYE